MQAQTSNDLRPEADCLHIVQCFAVLVKLSRRSERQTGAFCLSVLYRMQREAEAKEHTPELASALAALIAAQAPAK